jgi:hypothetical protein
LDVEQFVSVGPRDAPAPDVLLEGVAYHAETVGGAISAFMVAVSGVFAEVQVGWRAIRAGRNDSRIAECVEYVMLVTGWRPVKPRAMPEATFLLSRKD